MFPKPHQSQCCHVTDVSILLFHTCLFLFRVMGGWSPSQHALGGRQGNTLDKDSSPSQGTAQIIWAPFVSFCDSWSNSCQYFFKCQVFLTQHLAMTSVSRDFSVLCSSFKVHDYDRSSICMSLYQSIVRQQSHLLLCNLLYLNVMHLDHCQEALYVCACVCVFS